MRAAAWSPRRPARRTRTARSASRRGPAAGAGRGGRDADGAVGVPAGLGDGVESRCGGADAGDDADAETVRGPSGDVSNEGVEPRVGPVGECGEQRIDARPAAGADDSAAERVAGQDDEVEGAG